MRPRDEAIAIGNLTFGLVGRLTADTGQNRELTEANRCSIVRIVQLLAWSRLPRAVAV